MSTMLEPGDRVLVLDPRKVLGTDTDGGIGDLIGNEYILDRMENVVFWKLKDCSFPYAINEKLLQKVEWSPEKSPIDDESVLSLLIG